METGNQFQNTYCLTELFVENNLKHVFKISMLDEKLEPVAIETRFNVRRKTNSDSKNLCLSLQNTG